MDRSVDFKKLVADMRSAQKQYFKTRDRKDLQKAKEREKEVDEFLAKYFQRESQNKTLFD